MWPSACGSWSSTTRTLGTEALRNVADETTRLLGRTAYIARIGPSVRASSSLKRKPSIPRGAVAFCHLGGRARRVGLCQQSRQICRIFPFSLTRFLTNCDTNTLFALCFQHARVHLFRHPTLLLLLLVFLRRSCSRVMVNRLTSGSCWHDSRVSANPQNESRLC
jgi:hypothetical protein